MSKDYEQYCVLMKTIGWPAVSEEEWSRTHGVAPVEDVSDTPPEWNGTQRDGHENRTVRREPDHATFDANGNERATFDPSADETAKEKSGRTAEKRARKFMSAKGDASAYE